jgi:hypothetical protein
MDQPETSMGYSKIFRVCGAAFYIVGYGYSTVCGSVLVVTSVFGCRRLALSRQPVCLSIPRGLLLCFLARWIFLLPAGGLSRIALLCCTSTAKIFYLAKKTVGQGVTLRSVDDPHGRSSLAHGFPFFVELDDMFHAWEIGPLSNLFPFFNS